jgi:hypothetical protein
LEVLAVYGKMPIVTVDFCRGSGGRLALAAVESDDLVPELNEVLESGLTDEAGRADREYAHRS